MTQNQILCSRNCTSTCQPYSVHKHPQSAGRSPGASRPPMFVPSTYKSGKTVASSIWSGCLHIQSLVYRLIRTGSKVRVHCPSCPSIAHCQVLKHSAPCLECPSALLPETLLLPTLLQEPRVLNRVSSTARRVWRTFASTRELSR